MDAIGMLTKDHETVRDLFRRYNGGGGFTGLIRRTAGLIEPRAQRSVLARVCRELEAHTRIEERVFYPAVRALGDDELSKLVDEALVEHTGVKAQVAELRRHTGEAEKLGEKVGTLERDVEHHAREEEREMFPRVADLMPETQRGALAKRMATLKKSGGPRLVTASGHAKRARVDSKRRVVATKSSSRVVAPGTRSRKRTIKRAPPGGGAKSRAHAKRKVAPNKD